MSTRSESATVRICGRCVHAKDIPEHVKAVETESENFKHQNSTYLALLRRSNPLKASKMHCQKESLEVGFFEEACAFWNEK